MCFCDLNRQGTHTKKKNGTKAEEAPLAPDALRRSGREAGRANRHELDRAKRFCLRFVHPDKSRMDQDAATDKRTLVETALQDSHRRNQEPRLPAHALLGQGAIAVKDVRDRPRT